MDLKEQLKNTFLIPNSIKNKLLSMESWPKEIEDIVKDMFSKYSKKEEKVKIEMNTLIWRTYIKSIQDMELEEKKKDDNYMKELENKINEIKNLNN